jgi:hypothetical protein
MSDEKQGRGRPPKDPLLSGYGDTKLLSVKVPAAQYEQINYYIQQRFEQDGFHLGVSDVVRHALVKLGINGIAAGKDALEDERQQWLSEQDEIALEDAGQKEVLLTDSGVDEAYSDLLRRAEQAINHAEQQLEER